jgi:hypothetical protein
VLPPRAAELSPRQSAQSAAAAAPARTPRRIASI